MRVTTLKEKLSLRKRYLENMDIVMDETGFDPYVLIENLNMTPIEDNVWASIRYLGIRMWPQFPIRNYFVDFADPIQRICVEVDGKQYHQDKEKDMKRQKEIEGDGWQVIRIEGRHTYRCLQEEENEQAVYEERNSEKINCICATCILRPVAISYHDRIYANYLRSNR